MSYLCRNSHSDELVTEVSKLLKDMDSGNVLSELAPGTVSSLSFFSTDESGYVSFEEFTDYMATLALMNEPNRRDNQIEEELPFPTPLT